MLPIGSFILSYVTNISTMNATNEALNAAVQKRSALYDKTEKNYSNRIYIARQWKEIRQELGTEASARPVHEIISIASKLARIATHSCVPEDGLSVHGRMPQSTDVTVNTLGSHTQAGWAQTEKLILQTLKDTNMELNNLLNEINSKGEIYDVVSRAISANKFHQAIERMASILEFRADWKNSCNELTSQQVVRMKTLVRTAGYVYHLQIQNITDTHLFDADTQHLQKILTMLQRITCILRNLLPNVDVKALVVNSDIPNSFNITIKPYLLKMFRMRLTLLDLNRSVKDMSISVADATVQIE